MEYDYDNIPVNTIYLNTKEFNKLKQTAFDFNILKDVDEKYALACVYDDLTIIFINKKEFDKLNKNEKKIVLAHELAHTIGGIVNNEEADMWALESLNKTCRRILIKQWLYRHGHPYKGK
jgi:Zn-dependent peptidase ImmA (M78 family)